MSRIAMASLVVLALWLPSSVAAPLGDNSSEDGRVRLSMAHHEYDWFSTTHLGLVFAVAGEDGVRELEPRPCFRFENIGPEPVHQPLSRYHEIHDDQGRLVYEHRHWQSATDTIQPREQREACWDGQTNEDYPGAVSWAGRRSAPPGLYQVSWDYLGADWRTSHTITVDFALVDDSGLYAAGSI